MKLEPPTNIVVECPKCKEETLHTVIKGKMYHKQDITLDALVNCGECKHTHQIKLTEPGPIEVPVIVSDQERSIKLSQELDPTEKVEIGDEMQVEDLFVKVTAIECGPKRVNSAMPKDIDTLWVMRYDRIVVKVSGNHRARTVSGKVFAPPEEEFTIGDMVRIGKYDILVHTIKLRRGKKRMGSAMAKDVVRLYGKIIKSKGRR